MTKKILSIAAATILTGAAANAALLVHYDFNSSDATNSGTGADGTVVGGSTYVASTAGTNAGLAWTGDRATGNSAAILTGSTGTDLGFGAGGVYTSMAWVNWAGGSGNVDHMVFGQDDVNTGGNAAQLHHGIRDDSPANVHFGGWGGTQDIADAGTVPASTWTHVTWQYDGTDAVVFVNGAEVTREAKSNITDPSLQVLVGAHTRDNNATNPYQSFNGSLDDVRIYDNVLSQAEIMTAMNAVNVPEPSTFGLIGLVGLGMIVRRRR